MHTGTHPGVRRGDDDRELVEECLAGHDDAFAELVYRYQDNVFNLAYRMTGSTADAEDLSQQAFVRAYRKLRKYKPEYSFRNWVMTICANLTKNMFASRTHRRRVEEAHTELRELRESQRASERDQIEAALEMLPMDLRIPLVLKHVEGFSHEDISEILGITVSAAKMRVMRGKDELVRLVHHGHEPGIAQMRRTS